MRTPLVLKSAVVGCAVMLAAACSEAPTTAPAVRNLTPAPKGLGNVVQATIRTLTICAEGPAGTYAYTMSISATTKNTVNTPFGTSFTLAGAECKDVVTLTQGGGFGPNESDPVTWITVTQTSAPANTQLDYLQKTQGDQDQLACDPGDTFPCGIDTQEAGPTTTIGINYYHGSVISYWNEEIVHSVSGCTLTLGYWKNHTNVWPAPYSPTATFFTSGKSWIYELSAAPKGGNAYLILAHQWIATTLNLASGASVPADVKSAYDAGTTYFQNGGVGGDPIAWSTVLDNYNNGLAAGGPAHCN